MSIFKIGGLCVSIDGHYSQYDRNFPLHGFLSSEDTECVFSLEVFTATEKCYQFDVLHSPDEFSAAHIVKADGDVLLANDDWTKNRAFITESNDNLSAFMALLYYAHAVKKHMLQVHCSIVEYNGCGILFLGPSGIGKTTQAERWAMYRNALIINGDIGFVEERENEFLAWGTPWHGSSSYCENTSVPIKAMVVLEQSGVNRLRRLSGFEMVSKVSGNIFYPTWQEDGMELCLATLNNLLTRVPVYCLENKADEEAVNMLADELFLS